MRLDAYVAVVEREDLASHIMSGSSAQLERITSSDLNAIAITGKQLAVGYWSELEGGQLPDFIVVRDEKYDDAQAWISAFLPDLAPISQWCRFWRLSEIEWLKDANVKPTLRGMAGAWAGAIVAETIQNAEGNLTRLTTMSALASSNFCAARAFAVWANFNRIEDLASRYDALTATRRDTGRAIGAGAYRALWYALGGEGIADRAKQVLPDFVSLQRCINHLASDRVSPDQLPYLAQKLGNDYQLDGLERCGIGPQAQRVTGLDRLAQQLEKLKSRELRSALLGFGASLIDPGALYLPELLRRYNAELPTATVWAGAFAGLYQPARVQSEFRGLGRQVMKHALASSDINSKPAADISIDELARWTKGAFVLDDESQIRGLINRVLMVELLPSVATPVAQPRNEPGSDQPRRAGRDSKIDDKDRPRQHSLALGTRSGGTIDAGGRDDLERAYLLLEKRVMRLEAAVSEPATSRIRKQAKPKSSGGPSN